MRRKIIIGIWVLFALGVLSLGVIFFGIAQGWIGYMPPIKQLQNPIDKYASQVLSSDGEVLGTYARSGDNRIYVSYDEISPNLINALIATEDIRYYEHSGIDYRGLVRAVIKTGILRQSGAGGGEYHHAAVGQTALLQTS